MADDHSQRPYRSSDSVARSAPANSAANSAAKPAGSAPGAGSSSDPLAELARLIGQSDPFAEYGRDGARAAAAPPPPAQDPRPAAGSPNAPAPGYFPAPQTQPPLPDMQPFNPPNFARQSFGSPPLGAGYDVYQVEGNEHGYPAAAQDGGYEDEAYDPNKAQLAPEEADYYEDVPSSRRRMGIMVIAGVFALAVMGTAGAFGYRALFGSSGPGAQPPVIKAESAPSKIVPAASKDASSNKQITDRVNERGMGEKLVSREEQPVEIKDKPAGVVFPPGQDQSGSSMPAQGSGVVTPDAKRVRTIAIHPEQATLAEATPAAAPAPPSRVSNIAPTRPAAPAPQPPQQQAPPPRVVSNAPPAADPEPAPARRLAVTRAAPAAAPAASNAPLSLSPDARAPARAAAPAVRTTSVAATAAAPAASGGGSYAVQVSSQRSEAEAQAAFRGLQSKYPGQLGGKQPLIRRVDLGAKGIYYRTMVGPFATGGEASELCSSLKAAGGACIVQRN